MYSLVIWSSLHFSRPVRDICRSQACSATARPKAVPELAMELDTALKEDVSPTTIATVLILTVWRSEIIGSYNNGKTKIGPAVPQGQSPNIWKKRRETALQNMGKHQKAQDEKKVLDSLRLCWTQPLLELQHLITKQPPVRCWHSFMQHQNVHHQEAHSHCLAPKRPHFGEATKSAGKKRNVRSCYWSEEVWGVSVIRNQERTTVTMPDSCTSSETAQKKGNLFSYAMLGS